MNLVDAVTIFPLNLYAIKNAIKIFMNVWEFDVYSLWYQQNELKQLILCAKFCRIEKEKKASFILNIHDDGAKQNLIHIND